jgi:hypothetical protein
MNTLSILRWFWDRLDLIVGILLIPWGFFIVSLALVGWKKFTRSSGSDIYVILTSLDFEFLVFHDKFIYDVYGGIQPKFEYVFASGFIISLTFLVWASRVQHQIEGYSNSTEPGFPSGQMLCCWVFALVWMASHFAMILIR